MNKVPNLRFKEFSGDWGSKKIGEITIKVGSGKTPKGGNSVYTDEGIIFLRSQNVLNGKLSLDDVAYITEDINSTMKSTEVYPNDILLNITGASIGRSCCVPESFERANVNQHVCIIRLNKNYNSNFVMNQIISSRVQKQINSFQAGGNREGLNFEQIKGMKISSTTLEEQEKIASFFSLIDKKIELQIEKIEELKNYKKGIMQKIFSQELRFKDENGNEYPEWYLVQISNLLSIPEKRKEENVKKEKLLTVKLHRQGVCKNNNTDTLEIGATVYYIRKSGQLIYGKQNLFNGAIDIIPDYLDGYLSSGDVPALDINVEKVIPQFLLYLMGRTSFYKPLEALASGTGSKRIHEDTLLNIKVCIPSKLEQAKITKVLGALDFKIEKEQGKLDTLNNYKKGLLQQMFI